MYYCHLKELVGSSKSSRAEEEHLFTLPDSRISSRGVISPILIMYYIQFTYGMVANLSIRPYLCNPTANSRTKPAPR